MPKNFNSKKSPNKIEKYIKPLKEIENRATTNNIKNKKKILGYKFNNPELLQTALTHPSSKKNPNFQRFEFLGDRILSWHISYRIFQLNEKSSEGELSMLLSKLVSANGINNIIRKKIENDILYTGELTNSIVADAFEAILAAIFLDGGDTYKLIDELWGDIYTDKKEIKPAKNILQEIDKDCYYNIHKKNELFIAKITLNNTTATGKGSSKKIATNEAAKNYLKIINKNKKI